MNVIVWIHYNCCILIFGNLKTKIIEFYFKNQRFNVLAKRAYHQYFNMRIWLLKPTINDPVARDGSITRGTRNLSCAGRWVTAQTNENIERVRVHQQGRRSIQLGLTRRSLLRLSGTSSYTKFSLCNNWSRQTTSNKLVI